MENIFISHGIVLTIDENDSILEDGAIAIDNGRIVSIGKTKELIQHYSNFREIDASGMIVMGCCGCR